MRAWLFEVYSICKDKDAHEAVNLRTRNRHNFMKQSLNNDSVDLRDSIYRDRENWFNIERIL